MKEDYRFFPKEDINLPFSIELSGISYCDGSYRIERHNSEEFVFEYIVKGVGTVISEGKTCFPSSGDVYILHQGSDHTYFSDAKDPWTKLWFNVRGPLVESLLEAYGIPDKIYFPACGAHELFREFISTVRLNLPTAEIFRRCALLMHQIIACAADSSRPSKPDFSPELKRMKEFLDEHVRESITVSQLAKIAFRSESQTIRIFKEGMGVTPYAYFLQKKLEMAKSLLTGTTMSVKEISLDLGFSDQHYFSGLVRKATGKSPTEYRKSSAGNSAHGSTECKICT